MSGAQRDTTYLGEEGAGNGYRYSSMSNIELQRLLHERMPNLRSFIVSDETRETAIAILKVADMHE